MIINKADLAKRIAEQADAKKVEGLIRHISTRTVAEIKYIMQRKRKYYAIIKERGLLPPSATAAEIEIAAFFLAADDIRRSRPKITALKVEIEREKRARAEGVPDPKTLKGKIYKDFEEIDTARKEGATWEDIRRALKKHSRYKGEALDLATLSHTYLKIKRAKEQKTPA